jgi:D-amino-acid dehydrogenase
MCGRASACYSSGASFDASRASLNLRERLGVPFDVLTREEVR